MRNKVTPIVLGLINTGKGVVNIKYVGTLRTDFIPLFSGKGLTSLNSGDVKYLSKGISTHERKNLSLLLEEQCQRVIHDLLLNEVIEVVYKERDDKNTRLPAQYKGVHVIIPIEGKDVWLSDFTHKYEEGDWSIYKDDRFSFKGRTPAQRLNFGIDMIREINVLTSRLTHVSAISDATFRIVGELVAVANGILKSDPTNTTLRISNLPKHL